METRRLLYIDKLKALAMLLVVMGHTIYFCMYHEQQNSDTVLGVICTFHVPLFFFLSGFVVATPPTLLKFLGKARRFLVPMVVVGLINALLIGRVRDFFVDSGHNGYWYLLTLTIFYLLLVPFLHTKDRRGIRTLLMDVGMAAALWVVTALVFKAVPSSPSLFREIVEGLNVGGVLAFWPYFIVGYLCRKYALTASFMGKPWVAVALVLAYLALLMASFSKLDSLPFILEYTIALTAIAALLTVFYLFGNSTTFVDRQLLLIGRRTLDIYIFHFFFIRFISLEFLKGQPLLMELAVTVMLTIAIVYASMGIGHIVRRVSPGFFFLLLPFTTIAAVADNYDKNNYPPMNSSVQIDETNLPIVFIDTHCGQDTATIIHYDWRVAVRMKIIDNADGTNYGDTIAHPNQRVDHEGWVAIKYRGNSSFKLSEKKPYGFKTLETSDVEGKKKKVSLMGMPKDNDWVMMAPYNDRSLIRDVLMFQLASPYFDYTPKARHCELVIDGIYRGVYVMAERVRKGKNRLDLEDPGDSGDALTGGYHVQIDRNDEPHYYISKHYAVDQDGNRYMSWARIYFLYEHPEYDEMMPEHPEQLKYLQSQIDKMEDALASPSFTDPEEGYRQYLDPISFIDFQLSQEVSNNVDGYRLSTHLYKHRDSQDGRFKTALWDFNIAFGNANFCGANETDFWRYQNTYFTATNCVNKIPFWWMRLMEDPEYVTLLKRRWMQYRLENYSDEHIEQVIDSLTCLLIVKGAVQRNYEAFPIWGKNIWPVPDYQNVNTFEKEIITLKRWLRKRLEWMDEQLDLMQLLSGIEPPCTNDKHVVAAYYNMQGIRLTEPPRHGVFLVRFKDGSSRKVFR